MDWNAEGTSGASELELAELVELAKAVAMADAADIRASWSETSEARVIAASARGTASGPSKAGPTATAPKATTPVMAVHPTPIVTKEGRSLGVLSTYHEAGGEPDDRARLLLSMIARCGASVIERAQGDEASRATRQRYRTLVEATSAVVWACPPSGLHVEPQPSWMAFTGQTATEMLGAGWVQAVHPEDRDDAARRWTEAVARGVPFLSLHRIRRYDGAWRRMSVHAVPIREADGGIHEWFGMCFDVTDQSAAEAALRTSEERFRVALAEAPALPFQQDRDLRYTWVYKVLNPRGVSEILGKTDADLLPAPEAEALMRIKRRVMETGERAREMVHVTLGQESYDLDLRVEPMRDVQGRMVGVTGVAWDVTEQVRLREALEARTRQLARLAEQVATTEEETRRAVAQRLHDELQQLLVAAKLRIEQLLASEVGRSASDVRKVKEILLEALETSRDITRDLAPPVRPVSDLPAALEWLAQRQHDSCGLRVDLSTPDGGVDLPDAVARFLLSAARELLLNVVKHSRVKRASMSLERREGSVKMTVRDRGIGFDIGAAPLEKARGLGLFSIRERVELLGGTVSISSRPEEGTTVSVSLPVPSSVQPPAALPLEPPWSHPMDAAATEPGRGAIRVVVVDDHATVRENLSLSLGRYPDLVVVGQANDGKQAIELVERVQPEVVVLDVSMPVLGGIEATLHLRRCWPGTRVIGLTTHADQRVHSEMLEAGAEYCVTKGIDVARLVAMIRGR